jgi:CarD family transcriptional regulator
MSETEAVRLVEVNLAKGPKRGKTIEEDDTQEEEAA